MKKLPKVVPFPLVEVEEKEYARRAEQAYAALRAGRAEIGSAALYGPHGARLSLLRWALQSDNDFPARGIPTSPR